MNGLQLRIDKCPFAWKERARPYRYACCAKVVAVVRLRPVLGTNTRLADLPELRKPNAAVHLLLTLTLPQTAPTSLENSRSALSYTFTAA